MPVVGAVDGLGWRWTWLAVPMTCGLAALALLRLRPADEPWRRRSEAGRAWRRPDVARFAGGELLANAAWASVLTYSGALLLGSYGISPAAVALGLGASAVAMVPGTFTARRSATRATPAMLAALTALQGGAVIVLGALRPAPAATLAVIAAMAFVNGWRSMIASSLGMDRAPEDKVAVMSMRAAANQLGYLLGAAAGGLAIAVAGYSGLGLTLGVMFWIAALIHLPRPDAEPQPAPAAA
jgi:predicted MFS family arabinose efflux permease